MSRYAFITGKDPDLSLAELNAVYPQALFDAVDPSFIVMEDAAQITQKAFDRLGGVVKVAEIQKEVDKMGLDEALLELLLDLHEGGKLNYGVSVYGMPQSVLRRLLLSLKKNLRSAGVSSRFANQNFKNLSSPQKKGLRGPEIIICELRRHYLLGQVVASQNIDAYSRRDYDKPFRDMKVGMLPPKLAQILVNLTGVSGRIWDPFCGGGVLVMEGLLSGHDMLGSDINAKTLLGAQQNIDWMRQTFNLASQAELFEHDATKPAPQKTFEAIAFEGYLGPPQSRLKSERELTPIFKELDMLYLKFFQQLKQADFKGPIVTALPFFRVLHGRERGLNCIEAIEKLGFKRQSLLPHRTCLSLKYARHDQVVGREVFKFVLNK